MDLVEISLSKTKSLFNIGILFCLIFLGVVLVYISSTPNITLYSISTVIPGIACIVVSAFTIKQYVSWFSDKKIGLRIDSTGITDNSSAIRIGFIPWDNIVNIEVMEIGRTKMLLLFTNNVDTYLVGINKIKRESMEMRNDMYGTPFIISDTSLKCNFSELEKIVKDKFHQRLTGH